MSSGTLDPVGNSQSSKDPTAGSHVITLSVWDFRGPSSLPSRSSFGHTTVSSYHVFFKIDKGQLKKLGEYRLSEGGSTTWEGEEAYATVAESSKVIITVQADRKLWPKRKFPEQTVSVGSLLEGANTIKLPVEGAEDIQLRISATKASPMSELNAVVPAVPQSQNDPEGPAVARLDTGIAVVHEAGSMLEAWEPLLEKVDVIVKVFDAVAEVHPYANMAWKCLSAGYQLYKDQKDRDENIDKLIDAMNDAYSFVQSSSQLKEVSSSQRRSLATLVQETTQCAYFIKLYIEERKAFGSAVRNKFSDIDKAIDDYISRFLVFRQRIMSHDIVQVQNILERTFERTAEIADASALAYMPYSDGARHERGKQCLPGTRQAVLERIYDWINMAGKDAPRLFLLTGTSGSGKSAIAHTVASFFDSKGLGLLGSSYCFSRDDARNRSPIKFFPTIALDTGFRPSFETFGRKPSASLSQSTFY